MQNIKTYKNFIRREHIFDVVLLYDGECKQI